MTAFYVVVDKPGDWQPYYPSQDVITFDEYLNKTEPGTRSRVRVINLCRSYRYLGSGYYCSLLAEARGHHVFPSVATITDLTRKTAAPAVRENIEKSLNRLKPGNNGETLAFISWFGETRQPDLARVAQSIFEQFPCPILEVQLLYRDGWTVKQVKAASLKALTDADDQESFALTFEKFSRKMWRKPKTPRSYRYDLAILVNPEEEFPPSDKKALRLFEKAANRLGMDVDFLTRKDFMRLPEYDGLFIRETTAVDNHTYRFAKKAETEDMAVIDDPTSILRCTNKVYLADLLKHHKVPTPATMVLNQPDDRDLEKLATEKGLPLVLKIPDGSFSRGIIKAGTVEELKQGAATLLKDSALLLAQEYMYTEYDWRIGVLNNKPLYACRYYMVRNHWQIYKHGGKSAKSGTFDTLPTFEAPRSVLDAAIRATHLIGNGFYGVDIKQSGDRVVVIEVNDNPNVDAGIEDHYLGEKLYDEIMAEFLRRMEARGR